MQERLEMLPAEHAFALHAAFEVEKQSADYGDQRKQLWE